MQVGLVVQRGLKGGGGEASAISAGLKEGKGGVLRVVMQVGLLVVQP